MKRIVDITYKANAEEIETVRRFYNLVGVMDQDTYNDLQDKISYGLYEALGELLDVIEEEED